MGSRPQDLIAFGESVRFPGSERFPEQLVTLRRLAGPSLVMRFGAVAIADPWFPEAAPRFAAGSVGGGERPVALTTLTLEPVAGGAPFSVVVAATIGDVERVVSWQPLDMGNAQFELAVDSGLAAFYEITDAPTLQPVFEDDQRMKAVHDRLLTELVVPMEVEGRLVAVAMLTPGLYPAWHGFNADMVAVAVLLDLGYLDQITG